MAGFHLTTGNDQLRLVACMGEQLSSHRLTHALEPERIMVQSMGMQRWISLRLAAQLGIAANIRYLFPNQFLEEIFERVITGFRKETLFDREAVSWKIMELLPSQLERTVYHELKGYLADAGDVDSTKSWQLSRKIAYLFDQYCMYRPEMIEEWERGDESGWQADLWRTLRENGLECHLPMLRADLFKAIGDSGNNEGRLPERISVFGITSLPPLHVKVLAALSRLTDVYLYFLNPTPEFWGDILSRREIARRLGRYDDPELSEEALHLEQGNPLLASLGRTGRTFFDLIHGADFNIASEQDVFVEPVGRSLLESIQSDIYHLHDPDRGDYPSRSRTDPDESVQIHACHSRMREVEVLYDRLQKIMMENPTIRPGDILVMAPDINPFAPIIKAVFSRDGSSRGYLPYSIADRQFSRESKVIQWFLKLLEIPGSRFSLSDIMELLEAEAILDRFGIDKSEVHLLQDWLTSANVRWGMDAEHKTACGTPGIHQNTWEFGLDRLLLGLAMPDDGEAPFADVLPFDRIEGSQGILLGKFISFFSELSRFARSVSSCSLEQWSVFLRRLIDGFFAENEAWNDELQTLRTALDDMVILSEKAASRIDVEFDVIRLYLAERMEQSGGGFGFLGSGITFCSMLPMRSIPFKIVCLLGMNDQEFPRQNRPLGFDLIARNPRPGDRSLKDDDRYLFLEAILSAGEILYISYIGRNIKDNSPIPPAIVVSELIQYCNAAVSHNDAGKTGFCVKQQRLQAFSPHYFRTDTGPVGFSEDNLEAARVLVQGRNDSPAPFINRLPEPDDQWQQIELDQLVSFFSNPCRFLLRERLGLNLDDNSSLIQDAEPFTVDGLEKYQLGLELVDAYLEGRSPDSVRDRMKAEGTLPPGTSGDLYYAKEVDRAKRYTAALIPFLSGSEQSQQSFEVELAGTRVTGNIGGIYPEGMVYHRMAQLKTKDFMTGWLNWLIVNLLHQTDTVPRSTIIGWENRKKLAILQAAPVPEPERYLETLLGIFREGLVRPLPFPPASAGAYARALTGKKPDTALKKALDQWEGGFRRGEREDPYFARCFGHTNPIGGEFADLCRDALLPVFEHYTKGAT